MGWPLLLVRQEEWLGRGRWGTMFLRAQDCAWERLCYSYELPWMETGLEPSRAGACILQEGSYILSPACGEDQDWCLELRDTGYFAAVQICKAKAVMGAQGCIQPVHARPSDRRNLIQWSPLYQRESFKLMHQIQLRHKELRSLEPGSPEIILCGTLPATGERPRYDKQVERRC